MGKLTRSSDLPGAPRRLVNGRGLVGRRERVRKRGREGDQEGEAAGGARGEEEGQGQREVKSGELSERVRRMDGWKGGRDERRIKGPR